MTKILSIGFLALYIILLVWLVLFKLKFNIPSLFQDQQRTLNLIPFAAPSILNGRINYGEMIMNCLFFIPFGLLLNINFKKAGFLPKLAVIFGFSITAELLQYIFAIGATDITDLITNTFGGFLGLIIYDLCNKYVTSRKLDRSVIALGILLVSIFMLMRVSHVIIR